MVHVPYKGVAPAIIDVIAGQIEMQFIDVSVVVGHIRNGKVRAVAWAGAKRGSAFPDLSTVAESGFPGFDVTGWYGILGAAGTPKDIVAKLNGALVKVLSLTDARERFDAIGAVPLASTPDEFAAYIRAELSKWSKVAKAADLKVE
jgi:tripartite-type tricarboxylate transporter receptor subunit TctC